MIAHPLTTDKHSHSHHHAEKTETSKSIEALEHALLKTPNDFHTIEKLLQTYIQTAKKTNKGYYLRKAEKLLERSLKKYPLNYDLRMHNVDILQHTHRFDEALKILHSIIKTTPKRAEPYLVQATIYQEQGQFKEALSACKQLILRSSHLLSTTCITSTQSHQGKLAQSYELLKNVYAKKIYHEKNERLWTLTSLSDMAYRLNDKKQSLDYLQEALSLQEDDYFVLKKISDLYLESKQYTKVKTLLTKYQHIDSLFLRQTVARAKLGEVVSAEKKNLKSFLKHLKAHNEKPHLEDLTYYSELGLM